MNCLATFLPRSAFWTARFPWLLSNCVSCFHSFCGRQLANLSRSFRQHRSQCWSSPQHRCLCCETVAKHYWGWFGRPWPLLRYHLNRRSVPESNWTFMPKSEDIHPNWCRHISGDWMNSVKLSSDLWPAIITVQLMLAARWEFLPPASSTFVHLQIFNFNMSLVE